MTLDEKITLLHGHGWQFLSNQPGGADGTEPIPRLGIPALRMADSSYGVTHGAAMGRYSTALPDPLAAASTWDPNTAFEYGALIGRELRDQGYNLSQGGGVNLAREPRDGRTFEYFGEDPLLAGTLAGEMVRGVQSEHVIGDLKHYAVNDQESGRNALNANIDRRSMREADLLAFQIALSISHAGVVMCAYNRVNGDYACENRYLLTDVLKKDFGFKGFVVSDWGGTHSTVKASHAGLDQEQPDQFFYGESLTRAVKTHEVSPQEIDDHVHRVLRSMFAAGLFDHPVKTEVPDVFRGLQIAQTIAEKSIVLLRNERDILPLQHVHTAAVIGGHADVGVLSGGGSAQVDPPGGSPVAPPPPGNGFLEHFIRPAWMPSSPLRALRANLAGARVSYVSGEDLAAAAAAAKNADVAIVFAYQWESEGFDLRTLALAPGEDRLIETVAAANPHTVVVLETGGPVTMPWIDKVGAIIETWYPGIGGGEAIARILTGEVSPTGRLPISFPKSDADLPHPVLVIPPPASDIDSIFASGADLSDPMKFLAKGLPPFQIHYDERLQVGYKWYDAERKDVLFPFGFGLSYTRYEYSGLRVRTGKALQVSFTVKNTGPRAGTEVAQVYASLPASAGEPPKRLIAWARVALAAGESKPIALGINRDRLSIFDAQSDGWKLVPGGYRILVGSSSRDLPLSADVTLH